MKDLLSLFKSRRGRAPLKDQVSASLREIEEHQRELKALRDRFSSRARRLLEQTSECLATGDRVKSGVFATEHAELSKVLRTIYRGELALNQLMVRLESVKDVGDAMHHMAEISKIVKRVEKTVVDVMPAFDSTLRGLNDSITETLTELEQSSLSMPEPAQDKIEDIIRKATLMMVPEGELGGPKFSALDFPAIGLEHNRPNSPRAASGLSTRFGDATPKDGLITQSGEALHAFSGSIDEIERLLMRLSASGAPVDSNGEELVA